MSNCKESKCKKVIVNATFWKFFVHDSWLNLYIHWIFATGIVSFFRAKGSRKISFVRSKEDEKHFRHENGLSPFRNFYASRKSFILSYENTNMKVHLDKRGFVPEYYSCYESFQYFKKCRDICYRKTWV